MGAFGEVLKMDQSYSPANILPRDRRTPPRKNSKPGTRTLSFAEQPVHYTFGLVTMKPGKGEASP